MSDVLDLACDLIRRPSVTPDDAGCQALIGERLAAAGFKCESLPFGAVSNLWATHGHGHPCSHWSVIPMSSHPGRSSNGTVTRSNHASKTACFTDVAPPT